jgi:hypothetical protein
MGIQVTRTGTGWTVDVTALALVPDTLEKDFIVLAANVEQPLSSYTKTSATVLTYVGVALAANTVLTLYRYGLRDVDQLFYGEVTSQLGMNKRLTQIERALDDLREIKQSLWGGALAGDTAVAAHVALADPHTQYRLKTASILGSDVTGVLSDSVVPASIARDSEVTAAVAAHVALADPHPVYTTAAELTTALANYLPTSQKSAANGIAPLDVTSKLPAINSRPSLAAFAPTTGTWSFTWADGTIQTIDTPAELVFQSVNYNSATKQVTFTLVGGATTSFSLNDLVDLPEVQVATAAPVAAPTTGQRIYLRSDNGDYYVSNGTAWTGPFLAMLPAERAQLAALPAALDTKQPIDADLTAIAGITTLGVLNRTAADTFNTLAVGVTGAQLLAASNAAAALSLVGIPLVGNVKLQLTASNGLSIVTPAASTGVNWTAIGNQAAANNTTGAAFIAIGDNAGANNLTGGAWTAIGQFAGTNAKGSYWTAIGQYAGFQCIGDYWLAIGTSAGYSTTTAANWLAFGLNSGYSNVSGFNWQAIGVAAGYNNISGSNWLAQGFAAGYSNTTGNDWIAQGLYAGYYNTTGSDWLAVGSNASGNNTTGSKWLAIGTFAGYDSTTGSNNIFIGYNAGRGVITGNGNVVIGANSTGNLPTLTNTVLLTSGDGVAKLTADATGCRIGNNNADSKLKLISPNGTVYRVSVTDAGVLTITV